MKVILKQDVRGVGRKFEVKDVADGYANNFLLPRKLAGYASAETVKKAETLKLANLAEIELREKLTRDQIEMLKDVKVILNRKGNEKGNLFEKIHAEEISKALKNQANIQIDPEFIKIEKPIKEKGEHKVLVELGKSRAEIVLLIE